MQQTPVGSLLVLLAIALVCSVLVSLSAIGLRPIQQQNQLIERYRNIVALMGVIPAGEQLDDEAILAAISDLDVRVVNIERGEFEPGIEPGSVDARSAVNDPDRSVAIPAEVDLARLGRRAVYEVIYLVWKDAELRRIILPIHGQGMWSTLYGYLALENDFNTIAAVTFYEQAETAGLGDQIQNRGWLARWQGRALFNSAGEIRFRIARGLVEDATASAAYQVDGLSGATITGNAVTALVHFWFGKHGYASLLKNLKDQPPIRSPIESTGDTG